MAIMIMTMKEAIHLPSRKVHTEEDRSFFQTVSHSLTLAFLRAFPTVLA